MSFIIACLYYQNQIKMCQDASRPCEIDNTQQKDPGKLYGGLVQI